MIQPLQYPLHILPLQCLPPPPHSLLSSQSHRLIFRGSRRLSLPDPEILMVRFNYFCKKLARSERTTQFLVHMHPELYTAPT